MRAEEHFCWERSWRARTDLPTWRARPAQDVVALGFFGARLRASCCKVKPLVQPPGWLLLVVAFEILTAP